MESLPRIFRLCVLLLVSGGIVSVKLLLRLPKNPLASELDKKLRAFVDMRTGGLGSDSLWHYKGVIRNTLSGSEVVTIEGLERVRLVDTSWSPQPIWPLNRR